jgi:aspartokinase
MITLSQALEENLQTMPVLEEYLGTGLLNYSAVSRYLKPSIDKRLYKNVSEVSIMMALRRLSKKFSKNFTAVDYKTYIQDLTVRSNLVELTYLNSPSLPERILKLYKELNRDKSSYCTHSQGITETTIIINKNFEVKARKIFEEEKLLDSMNELSAIILRMNDEIVKTPGIYYSLLKKLLLSKVNLLEMISTTHELTLLFKDEDIQKAFALLQDTNH